MLKKLFTPLIAVSLILGVAGCAATAAADSGASSTEVAEDTVVLDVRTPAEYAAGHLEGAILLDLNGGEFAAALPGLDADTEYVVYCRSGNRSGQAVAMMKERGITKVTNLGALADAAAATGLPIVTP